MTKGGWWGGEQTLFFRRRGSRRGCGAVRVQRSLNLEQQACACSKQAHCKSPNPCPMGKRVTLLFAPLSLPPFFLPFRPPLYSWPAAPCPNSNQRPDQSSPVPSVSRPSTTTTTHQDYLPRLLLSIHLPISHSSRSLNLTLSPTVVATSDPHCNSGGDPDTTAAALFVA